MRTDGLTDTVTPICIHFICIVQRTRIWIQRVEKEYKQKTKKQALDYVSMREDILGRPKNTRGKNSI